MCVILLFGYLIRTHFNGTRKWSINSIVVKQAAYVVSDAAVKCKGGLKCIILKKLNMWFMFIHNYAPVVYIFKKDF